MRILSLFHFVAFLGYISLIIIVLSKNYKARLNQLCAILAGTFAFWSLGYALTNSATTARDALFWVNISSIGWVTFSVITMYFYLALAEKEKVIRNKWVITASVILVSFFLYQIWEGNIFKTVIPRYYGWSTLWATTPYTYLFFLYFFGVMSYVLYLIYDFGRKAKTNRGRIQARLLKITAIISLSLGTITDLILPALNISIIPEIADILIFIWVSGIVVCITKYGLMSVTPVTAAEQILKTSADMLLLLEADGRIKQSNLATLDLLEYQEAELYGQKFNNIASVKETADTLLTKTIQSGKCINEELDFKTKSGRNIQALVSSSVIQDMTMTVIGYVISAKDITELNKTRVALKQQKAFIDRIIDTTPNSVIVINKDSIIQLANKAFNIMFHKNGNEVIGESIKKILPVEILIQGIDEAKSHNEPHIKNEFKYHIEGHEYIFLLDILHMQSDEVLLIMTDVTEERNRQERLYLTDRLASVGEMASGVAHELNNPLTSIIGLSELLKRQETKEDIKEDLNSINSEAKRCAAIVKNLLTFARKHTLKKELIQLESVLEDVLRLRSYEHKVNNITVVTRFQKRLPKIMCDQFQIQQVFLNIIINAEQAMIEAHQKGILTISTEKTEEYVRVLFSDDGPGILPENMRKIFAPFFTTKEVGKGTGLGMSICYGIITNHKGRIYAESELGQGAIFTVELPVLIPN
jgi:PAS domain S-box-containing protein